MKNKSIFLTRISVLAILLVLGTVLSCNLFEKEESSDDIIQETRPISRVVISKKTDKNNFFLNDRNGVQILTASAYDSDGKIINGVNWNWNHNLTSDTEIKEENSVFSFNVNSINLQGDYSIFVTPETISKDASQNARYDFSLTSVNKLQNSLSYSLIDSGNSNFEIDEKQRVKFSSIREFDGLGNLITDASKRMTLDDRISYNLTGENFLYITQKNGTSMGKLVITAQNNNNEEQVPILYSDENGFILGIDKLEEGTKATINITVHAGTKDQRTISIDIENARETLSAPIITLVDAEYSDGKIFRITGDNITNSAQKIEGGNILRYVVTRCSYDGLDTTEQIYCTDGQDDFPESSDFNLGHKVHLLYSGQYEIDAYLVNGNGETSPHARVKAKVAPIQIPDGTVTFASEYPVETYRFPDNLDDVKIGYRKTSPVYSMKLKNNESRGYVVCEYTFKATNGANDLFRTGKNAIIIEPNSTQNFEFSESGHYEFNVYIRGKSSGDGIPYPKDYTYYGIHHEFTIKNPDDTAYLTASLWNNVDYMIEGRTVPDGTVVKFAAYREGELILPTVRDFSQEAYAFLIPGDDYKSYRAFEYTYNRDNTPCGVVNAVELPEVDYFRDWEDSDYFSKVEYINGGAIDNTYKKIEVKNRKANDGTYYDLFTGITASVNEEPSSWTHRGRVQGSAEVRINASLGEGEYVVWGKLQPPSSTSTPKIVHSLPIKIEKALLTKTAEIDLSDTAQEQYGGAYGKRIAVIKNIKDSAGNYCKVRYRLGNSLWEPYRTDEIITVELLTQEGEKEIEIECIPSDDAWQKGTTVAKKKGVLMQLPPPYTFITGNCVKDKKKWYQVLPGIAIGFLTLDPVSFSVVGGTTGLFTSPESSYHIRYCIKPDVEGATIQYRINEQDIYEHVGYVKNEGPVKCGKYTIRAIQCKRGYISSTWQKIADDWENGTYSCYTSGNFSACPF